jgi:ubiquinone/menaquinone biosynthesis C-methylase UbiE
LDKTINLLHVAPEKNLQKILKSFSNIEYVSGDLNPLVNCDVILDIADMNFEDNFFDVIVCNYVLEHIIDDQKAMSELFRVLKTEGFAILQVPISKNAKKPLKIFQLQLLKVEKNILGKKIMLGYMVRIIKKG